MKNWWYYHKWYVICGVILLGIVIKLAGNAFGWFQKSPDIQIAYIGEARLPEDTVAAIEKAFASLADDYNKDGEILVRINQFASGNPKDMDADTTQYREAALLTLMADINDRESYFFLMEDPDAVQKEFQVLAMPDGSCPDERDFTTEEKVISWGSCEPLCSLELGSYSTTQLGETITGKNQDLLSKLYLARRCFYDEKLSENAAECSELWTSLTGGLS